MRPRKQPHHRFLKVAAQKLLIVLGTLHDLEAEILPRMADADKCTIGLFRISDLVAAYISRLYWIEQTTSTASAHDIIRQTFEALQAGSIHFGLVIGALMSVDVES